MSTNKNSKSYSLSDREMRQYIPNVITYDRLQNMQEIELLSILPVIILYMNTENSGHWCLLHRTPQGIEHWDSYGIKPDKEFEMIPDDMQSPKYLAKLLNKIIQHTPIVYNQYRFQEMKSGVNTCGRWCILRNMFSHTGIESFKKAIVKVCKTLKIQPDDLVCRLITFV